MVDQKVEEGWRDSLYRAYKSSQQSMRVAVYGTKHDAATFERLLRDICVFEPVTQSRASAMIDTAVLGCPKVLFSHPCCATLLQHESSQQSMHVAVYGTSGDAAVLGCPDVGPCQAI